MKAVVVLKPGVEASEELTAEMQALVKEAKGSVQSPKTIDFVDAIPLTAVGKPDKKAVRAQYWEGAERGCGLIYGFATLRPVYKNPDRHIRHGASRDAGPPRRRNI